MIENLPFELPNLTADRLYLKQMTHADAGDLFEIRSNPDLMRFIPRPLAKTWEDAVALIDLINRKNEKMESFNWGFYLKSNHQFIGNGGFVNLNQSDFRGEIGYLLHHDFHGKGYAQEAMQAIVNYGFEAQNLHSIEAIINPANVKSIKLIERLGFVREAYYKDYFYFDGKFHDETVYSLITTL